VQNQNYYTTAVVALNSVMKNVNATITMSCSLMTVLTKSLNKTCQCSQDWSQQLSPCPSTKFYMYVMSSLAMVQSVIVFLDFFISNGSEKPGGLSVSQRSHSL